MTEDLFSIWEMEAKDSWIPSASQLTDSQIEEMIIERDKRILSLISLCRKLRSDLKQADALYASDAERAHLIKKALAREPEDVK